MNPMGPTDPDPHAKRAMELLGGDDVSAIAPILMLYQ